MAKIRQKFARFVGACALVLCGEGCSFLVNLEVKPSDCINPPAGDCTLGINESRILEVKLYQLKEAIDPCKLDIGLIAQGKEQEVLKGVVVETASKELRQFPFKVSANEPRDLGTWEVGADTKYVLAVAIGRGRSRNSVRQIPVGTVKGAWRFPTLHIRGYDICLDSRCTDHSTEAQCP